VEKMKLLAVICLISFAVQSRSQFAPTGVPPTFSTTDFTPPQTTVDYGYEGPRRCMVGTRSFDESGQVTSDNSFPSLCPRGQNYCAYFSYNITVQDDYGFATTYLSQTGYCLADPAEATCPQFTPFAELFGSVSNCFSSVCRNSTDEYVCNQFVGPKGACPEPEQNADLQLLPNCTMQQVVSRVFQCANILFSEYPFDNARQCSNAWDRTVQCMAQSATHCLSSNCPSILDNFPGVRSEFPEVVLNTIFINNVTTLSNILEEYMGFDIGSLLVPLACSGDSSGVVAALGQAQAQLAALDLEGLLGDFGLPVGVCPGAVSRLQNALFEFIPAVVGATNTNDVTNAFGRMQREVLQAFQGCDSIGIFTQISNILGGFDISVSFGTILNAVQSIQTLLPQLIPVAPSPGPGGPGGPGPVVPGACPAEAFRPGGFGNVRLNCERFHDDNTRCGRRRAWFCDYASWRVNFLRPWRAVFIREYGQPAHSWDYMLPQCRQEDDVRCARSQRCCYPTYDGCTVCFCQAHDYLDPDFLEGRWSADSGSWDRFFHEIQNRFAEQLINGNNNNNDDDHNTC